MWSYVSNFHVFKCVHCAADCHTLREVEEKDRLALEQEVVFDEVRAWADAVKLIIYRLWKIRC